MKQILQISCEKLSKFPSAEADSYGRGYFCN